MTDPLSLVFLACIVFSGAFLVITTISGAGQTHGLHFGHFGQAGGHAAHLHLGHAGHATHTGQAGAHAAHTTSGAAQSASTPSAWSSLENALGGAFNLYGILIFLLIFGLLGFLLHNATNLAAVLIVFIALLAGLAGAVATSTFLTRLFLANIDAAGLTSESSQLEGRLGTVSMLIREGGTGEVIFQGATGARQSLGARSLDGQPIAAGTEVVIIASRNGIAEVQPWDRFMASARAGEAPQLEALDQ
jgi:membrane protein implicated in regulation of membrane protease activity